jgi:endo-1,4-beta-xylanase
LAFQFAHEADPDAELYYNEYNVEKAYKRAATVNLVKSLQEKGIRIDGVGIQAHCTMTFPEYQQMDSSLAAIGALGISAMITELDLTVLPWPQMPVTADVNLKVKMDSLYNPYKNGLPDSAYKAFDDRYAGLFEVFLKHKDVISRVTMWGLTDAQSWRNYWPVFGRTDYPLLFDRNYQPKPIVERLIQMGNNSK